DLAGAAEAGFARCGDTHARSTGRLKDRVARLAGPLLPGGREEDPARFHTAMGVGGGNRRWRRNRVKRLLMVVAHVEAGTRKRLANCRHEWLRPAAEDGAVEEIGRQQRDLCLVDTPLQSRPQLSARQLLDDQAE